MKEKDTSPNEGIACRRIVNHRIYFVLLVIVFVEDWSVDTLTNKVCPGICFIRYFWGGVDLC